MDIPSSQLTEQTGRVSALTEAARLYADSFRGGATDIRDRVDAIIGADLADKLRNLLRMRGTIREKNKRFAQKEPVPDFVAQFRLAMIGSGKVSEIVALFKREEEEH